MEEFATLAILEHKEAHVVPFPDFVQFYYVWVIQDFQDIDFVYESGVVFYLLLLDSLHGEELLRLSVFGKVNNAEATLS